MRDTSARGFLPRRKLLASLAAGLASLAMSLIASPSEAPAGQPRHLMGISGARIPAPAKSPPHRMRIFRARALTGDSSFVAAPDASQPVSPSFYGLNAQALFGLPPSQWDAQLTKLAATGVGTVRFDTGWGGVEPRPPSEGVHDYNWTRLDQVVAALARHHLQGLPIIDYAAPWAESDAYGTEPGFSPPADPNTYASFARAVAIRYGPGGAFWAQNPALPAMPMNQYEIWNEENSDHFFHGTSAALYASLYADARNEIHDVDPAATVLVGGLVPTQNAIGWLNKLIEALPSHGHEIDAIGWHPYYSTSRETYKSLRALNSDLAAHSLDPPIVLTEVNSPEASSQAPLLHELAETLPRSGCNVSGMIVHTWSPPPDGEGETPYAIADPVGELNGAGLAYSSAVQAAETTEIHSMLPICRTPTLIRRMSRSS